MPAQLATWVLMVIPTAITQDVVVSSYPWHSSTYEEGVQRGYADVIRSWGMANLQNSQAAQGFEHARREYLDNRMKATQVYFEMRRYNEDARRAERGSPLSMEQYVRLARQMAPEPLGPSQLDPLTGAIGWPGPLRQAEYQTLRQRIERLFQDRTAGYADYAAIRVAIEDFYDQLRADIMKYQPDDYLVARKFLDSLAYMARATNG